MPEKVSVVTLGCEKNLVDSEIMSGLVQQRGFTLVEKPQEWMEEMPEIDGIVSNGDIHKISEIIDEALHGRKPVYVGNPVFNYEESMPRLLHRQAAQQKAGNMSTVRRKCSW